MHAVHKDDCIWARVYLKARESELFSVGELRTKARAFLHPGQA